jgi:mono/diheme cytochrome c family protein
MGPAMRRPTYRLLSVTIASALLLTWTWCACVRSQPAAPAPAEAPEKFLPGLSLTFSSTKDPKQTDARIARLVALNVPAGTAPTPFIAPAPFKATFEGFIEQRLRSDYEFSAMGSGKVAILINDKPVFEATGDLGAADGKKATLKKGRNKIVVNYESPEQGDATLRLYWAGDEFPAEPPDPKVYVHSSASKSLAAGLRVRDGRNLFADLHCSRCHTDAAITEAKDGMPELAKDAPNLDEVGSRLRPAWMAQWISNPKSLRPDTSMPNVFHAKAGTTVQEAADIASYLATLGQPGPQPHNEPDAVTTGGRIVARLGCIGCHTLADKDVGADPTRVPWRFVKAKYTPAGLVEFLKQPEKHFAWIRMPNFQFSDYEATSIAAYLLSSSKDLDGDTPKGDAAKGKQLVQSSGCVNCHNLKIDNSFKAPALAAIAKDGWTRGCLAADDAARGKAPDFALTPEQRDALIAFAATDRSSLTRDNLAEFAERQVTELRCVACHNRDTQVDVWDRLVKETESLAKGDVTDPESAGAAPPGTNQPPKIDPRLGGPKISSGEPNPGTGDQSRPPLTWVGEKLYPEWMATFIAGKIDYKPRAWMLARMPAFPARAEGLARGLALQHGYPIASPPPKEPDPELAKTGKQLIGRNGGFSCIQCHGIANIGPISPFEAPSINFKHTAERIQGEYYDRWMRNPIRLWPTTKMPAFADAEGKTSLRDVLEGDAGKQFDAIWNYLLAGRKIEHPEQEEAGK